MYVRGLRCKQDHGPHRCKSKRTIKYFFILGDEATEEEKAHPEYGRSLHFMGQGFKNYLSLGSKKLLKGSKKFFLFYKQDTWQRTKEESTRGKGRQEERRKQGSKEERKERRRKGKTKKYRKKERKK